MDGIRELVKGEVLDGFPGDVVNYSLRAARQFNQQQNPTQPAGVSGAPAVPVEVVNTSGEDFDARFPVVWLKKPLLTPDDNDQIDSDGVLWEAAVPDENTAIDEIAILDSPCGDGMGGGGTILGRCWCDVDIVNESDKFATVIEGDTTKLRSGGAGARIRWKPEGTGVKRCLIVLGGGASAKASVVGSHAYLLADLPASGITGVFPKTVSSVASAAKVLQLTFDGTDFKYEVVQDESGETPVDLVVPAILPANMPVKSGIPVPGNLITLTVDEVEVQVFEVAWSDYKHGVPGLVAEADQSLGRNANGEIEWQNDGPCTPGGGG